MTRLLVLFVVLCSTIPSSARTITVGTEDYPPWEWGFATGQGTGFVYEMMHAVCARLGCTVVYIEVPFKRALLQVEKGRQDALTSVFKTPERQQFAWYPAEPLVATKMLLMVRKGEETSRAFQHLDDLRGHKIALTRGYHYSATFNPFVEQHSQVQVAGTDTSNIRKLVQGKVDYFPK